MRYAYHGTPHIERVLAEGLRADLADGPSHTIWMARDPQEAAQYGEVVRIDLSLLSGSWPSDELDNWQAHYSRHIPPAALSRYQPPA